MYNAIKMLHYIIIIDITKSLSFFISFENLSEYCETGAYATLPTDCTRYLHCLFGKFEEFTCSAGLHWNQVNNIQDTHTLSLDSISYKLKKKKTTSIFFFAGETDLRLAQER